MQNPAQKAKARARQRTRPALAPANDNIVRFTPPLELTAADVVIEEHGEAPFAPPPVDDIFGLGECEDEEDLEFVAMPERLVVEVEEDEAHEAIEEDAPFDPPEFDDEPVFFAPASAQLGEPAPKPEAKPSVPGEDPPRPRERSLPAISIYASWDRPETEKLFAALAADPRLGRAEMQIARGGLDGAAAYCAGHEVPDLVILDTNLEGRAMLENLARLRAAAPRAAIVVIGAVNDIGLLRELAQRGVNDYIVPPANAGDIAASLCRLFAHAAPARVIAVIGARGGVGASTIAHNLAFSIAERQQQRTTLADFDLSFGAAAFNFRETSDASIFDVLNAADDADEILSRALKELTPRLLLAPAPERVECADMPLETFERAMAEIRRLSSFVVLDLPHLWEPWVRQALREADEVLIVAAPDLASLRNTDNKLKLLRSERDKPSAPKVVLSMAGIPKRPEIPLKDFAEALHVKPVMTFAFEPELFGRAAEQGLMIYETMPDAKAALQLDTLASSLTGCEPHAKPEQRMRSEAKIIEAKLETPVRPPEPATAIEQPVLGLVIEAPPQRVQMKRRAARTGFLALQEPASPKRRRSSGFLRAAAVVMLLAASVYWAQQQHGDGDAAPPQAMSATNA
ncbi:MAG: CpaE family protein [Hyphomonadaceae bacterium]